MVLKRHYLGLVLCYFLLLISYPIFAQKTDTKELFRLTDRFVTALDTDVESYGILSKCEVYTKDKFYQVKPIGRLVDVKIMKSVDVKTYERLCEKLLRHYDDDDRVRDVYITRGGTIVIDCRHAP